MPILKKIQSLFKNNHQNNIFETTLLDTVKQEEHITILATEFVLFIAYSLINILKQNHPNISINILTKPLPSYQDHLHIIISPYMYKADEMPKNYITYQLEQLESSKWFDENYQVILENSSMVLDYSKKNITFLEKKLKGNNKIEYYPISYFPHYKRFLKKYKFWDKKIAKKCDIIFYGGINDRRRKYLDILSDKFNIKIISGKFGNELYEELLSAKIVVNIHYYENAIVETTRIYESLSLGLTVVSEDGFENNINSKKVHFVPENDIISMCHKIESLL